VTGCRLRKPWKHWGWHIWLHSMVHFQLLGMLKTLAGNRKDVELDAAGQTIKDAIVALGIEPALVALVLVNNEMRSKDTALNDGDRVQLMAVVGGG